MVKIRRVRADEWEALRDLRLRALTDAPQAFLTTLAEATARPAADWREAAVRGATGDRSCTLIADDSGRLVGMATGYFPDRPEHALDDPSIPALIQMWVEPAARRTGVGSGLVRAVRTWAAERGAAVIRLEVNAAEPGAVAFYRAVGFRDTGREAKYPERDLRAIEMEAPAATSSGSGLQKAAFRSRGRLS